MKRVEEASGSGQESPDGGPPLTLRGINLADFAGPSTREVDRRPDQEREVFLGTCGPNLLVEFERFSGQVSAHVEQYQVKNIGLPQKACGPEARGILDLDAVTPQDGSARLARRFIGVDEENGLARKNRLATKWRWSIHTPPHKGKRNWADCPPAGCGSQQKYKGPSGLGCFYRMVAALSKSETANTMVAFLEPLVHV